MRKMLNAMRYVTVPCDDCRYWNRCRDYELACQDFYNCLQHEAPNKVGRHPTREMFIRMHRVGKDELREKMKWV